MSEAKHPKVMIIPAEAAKTAPADAYASNLRVAAYCRVSTSSDEQLSSYQAQLEYFVRKRSKTIPGGFWWTFTRIKASPEHQRNTARSSCD